MSHARPTSARRTSRSRKLLTRFVPLLLVLGLGAYVGACAIAPLPEPTLSLSAPETATIAADVSAPQAVVDAQSFPTAVGWLDDDDVWSNDDRSHPIASITKLVTVLVCLEEKPLAPGTDGPGYVWTAADRARQDVYLGMDGVAYPIPVGTEITLRQMLQLILLPSANDFAAAYAYWTFGDNDAFIAAVDAWKAKHGLESLTLVEPSGMDERNAATPADLVRIARLALQNPAVAEFTKMPSAVLPWGIGLVANTNPLLAEVPGVIGLKTGSLLAIGYNLLLAQKVALGDREVVRISATLLRPSPSARAQSGRDVLAALDTLSQEIPAIELGQHIGTLTGIDGAVVDLFADSSANVTLLPGEEAVIAVDRGASLVSVSSPGGNASIPIRQSGPLAEPDLWWRITHPFALFF